MDTWSREEDILSALRSAIGSARTVGELELGLAGFVAGARARFANAELTALENVAPSVVAALRGAITARRTMD